MSLEELNSFYLVGGTALALRIGHRKSIDIDMFANSDFNASDISFIIEKNFETDNIETGKNLVRCFISTVKLEFIAHQYPLIEPIEEIQTIRIASLKDLCAFKLNAIVNRGAKKDFWDIALMLNLFDLDQILKFYSEKYKNHNLWMVEKSLCYFKDADEEMVEIKDLSGLTWENVKLKIKTASKNAF